MIGIPDSTGYINCKGIVSLIIKFVLKKGGAIILLTMPIVCEI